MKAKVKVRTVSDAGGWVVQVFFGRQQFNSETNYTERRSVERAAAAAVALLATLGVVAERVRAEDA